MGRRTWAPLAWALWLAGMLVVAAGFVLLAFSGSAPAPDRPTFRLLVGGMAVAYLTVGLLIALRKPENAEGWLMLAGPISLAAWFLAQEYAVYSLIADPGGLPAGDVAAWLTNWTWIPAIGVLGTFLLLFPDGRPRSPRWRAAVWAMAASTALAAATEALRPGPIDAFLSVENPFGVESLPTVRSIVELVSLTGFGGSLMAAGVAVVLRLRSARGEERVQLRWVAFAASLVPPMFLIAVATDMTVGEGFLNEVTGWVYALLLFALPVAIGIAILKHRLFDIDVLINKAVVFTILGTFITAVYVGVVVGVGALARDRGSPILSAVAAAVVALAFRPVRDRARHVADRLVYGERATPYEVLSEFSARVAGSYGIEEVAPRMAAILGEGTGAEEAEVWLRIGSELQRVSAWPSDLGRPAVRPIPAGSGELPAFPNHSRAVAVRYRGEVLGALTIAKPASEPLTPTEERLVEDLARQAGLVLRNAGLLEELRASRQRLVRAQDEERRRLERNIHDGAQQQLVALAVKVRMAESSVREDADRTLAILADVRDQATDALASLRDLARGIYPPLLSDEGLAAALQAQTRKAAVPAEVRADGVARYPQEVEVTVYFCCLEALQNAAKYAQASFVEISLTTHAGTLRFDVRDDGRGFDPATTPRGFGLQNMTDRLEAVEGSLEIRSSPGRGTTVSGRIPVQGEAPAGPLASQGRSAGR